MDLTHQTISRAIIPKNKRRTSLPSPSPSKSNITLKNRKKNDNSIEEENDISKNSSKNPLDKMYVNPKSKIQSHLI